MENTNTNPNQSNAKANTVVTLHYPKAVTIKRKDDEIVREKQLGIVAHGRVVNNAEFFEAEINMGMLEIASLLLSDRITALAKRHDSLQEKGGTEEQWDKFNHDKAVLENDIAIWNQFKASVTMANFKEKVGAIEKDGHDEFSISPFALTRACLRAGTPLHHVDGSVTVAYLRKYAPYVLVDGTENEETKKLARQEVAKLFRTAWGFNSNAYKPVNADKLPMYVIKALAIQSMRMPGLDGKEVKFGKTGKNAEKKAVESFTRTAIQLLYWVAYKDDMDLDIPEEWLDTIERVKAEAMKAEKTKQEKKTEKAQK